jgi:hypothetical protein
LGKVAWAFRVALDKVALACLVAWAFQAALDKVALAFRVAWAYLVVDILLGIQAFQVVDILLDIRAFQVVGSSFYYFIYVRGFK